MVSATGAMADVAAGVPRSANTRRRRGHRRRRRLDALARDASRRAGRTKASDASRVAGVVAIERRGQRCRGWTSIRAAHCDGRSPGCAPRLGLAPRAGQRRRHRGSGSAETERHGAAVCCSPFTGTSAEIRRDPLERSARDHPGIRNGGAGAAVNAFRAAADPGAAGRWGAWGPRPHNTVFRRRCRGCAAGDAAAAAAVVAARGRRGRPC